MVTGASRSPERIARLLTGRGRFVADVRRDGMLHAVVCRSPLAHGRLLEVDVRKARSLPGVAAVFLAADLERPSFIPVRLCGDSRLEPYLQPALARDVVRYVGEPVALVVAIDRATAREARRTIDLALRPLPAVDGVESALTDQVLVHEGAGTNQAFEEVMVERREAVPLADVAYRRRVEFRVHRHAACPMETRGLVADYDPRTGLLDVWGATKVPQYNRGVLANLLGVDRDTVRFHPTDVGGGFGARGEFYPEDLLIPFASMRLGRPVRWIEDREEHFEASNHSREVRCEVEVWARSDGRILRIEASVDGDMGAYIRTHGSLVPMFTGALLTGPYDIASIEVTVRCLMTNKTPVGTYRGPGYYESCFVRERMLDIVALDLALDPIDVRRVNLIRPDQMPYRVGMHLEDGRPICYDSGDYGSALDRALEQSGYFSLRASSGRQDDGRYHGVGVGCYVEPTGFGRTEEARVGLGSDGRATVHVGIPSLGQAHHEILARICGEALSAPFNQVSVVAQDPNEPIESMGTFGSRVTVMTGSAIHEAAAELRRRLAEVAAKHLGRTIETIAIERDELVWKAGETVGRTSLRDILGGEDGHLAATGRFTAEDKPYSYGAHVARVAVDPETGQVEVLAYVAVEDVGRCVDRATLEGQIVGAVVQGIGGTLVEELVYDSDGQLLTGGLGSYGPLRARDVPSVESVILEEAPSPRNPLGVKGGGEGGIVATGAAIANAVACALHPCDGLTRLPLKPERVLRTFQAGGDRRGPLSHPL